MSIQITEEELVIFQKLFHHPAGKEAADLLRLKFINTLGFDTDPCVHAFNSGQRGLALLLCACADAKVEVVGTEQVDPMDVDNTRN